MEFLSEAAPRSARTWRSRPSVLPVQVSRPNFRFIQNAWPRCLSPASFSTRFISAVFSRTCFPTTSPACWPSRVGPLSKRLHHRGRVSLAAGGRPYGEPSPRRDQRRIVVQCVPSLRPAPFCGANDGVQRAPPTHHIQIHPRLRRGFPECLRAVPGFHAIRGWGQVSVSGLGRFAQGQRWQGRLGGSGHRRHPQVGKADVSEQRQAGYLW